MLAKAYRSEAAGGAPASAKRRGWFGGPGRRVAETAAPGQASAPPPPTSVDAELDLCRLSDSLGDAAESESLPPQPGDDLQRLLAAQQADGSFQWTGHVSRLVEQALGASTLQRVKQEMSSFGGSTNADVAQTISVLLLLETRFGSQKPLWQRAARKAIRDLIARTLGKSPPEVERWLADVLKPAIANA
jgi:hypothetical protein